MNMDFETFKTMTMDALQVYYGPENVEVTFQEVMKNNDMKQTGIMIRILKEDTIGAPVIYIDKDFQMILKGDLSFDSFVRKIIKLREQQIEPQISDSMEVLTNWEKAKEQVYPIIISAERNKKNLERLVYKDYLDLAIIYIIRDVCDAGYSTVRITNQLFHHYDITMEELHRQAVKNLKGDGYAFFCLSDLLACECIGTDEIQPVKNFGDELYCLTNKNRPYGAAGMLNMKMIEEAADGRDVYVIPSSGHELLFIRPNESISTEGINQMIQEINNSPVVAPDDFLSDHAYYYCAADREIRIAA